MSQSYQSNTGDTEDTIFSETLDLDYAVVAFEVVAENPDFWASARRWIEKSNHIQPVGSPYHLTEQRVSKIISLLTAQPLNPACHDEYDLFVNAAHDVLVHSARIMLNFQRMNQQAIAALKLPLPTPVAVDWPKSSVSSNKQESLLNKLHDDVLQSARDQVATRNAWSVDAEMFAKLKTLARGGQFPSQLAFADTLYSNFEDGHAVVNYQNLAEKPDGIKKLMSILLSTPIAQLNLQRHVLHALSAHRNADESTPMGLVELVSGIHHMNEKTVIPEGSILHDLLNPVACLAMTIDEPGQRAFLSIFNVDWDGERTKILNKLSAAGYQREVAILSAGAVVPDGKPVDVTPRKDQAQALDGMAH